MALMGTDIASRARVRLRGVARYVYHLVRKPVLPYVEIHLADHCNLNCKGCGHFSSIASKWFVDLKHLSADLDRMSRLFGNIARIRLMGGEPLLHAGVTEAIAEARRFFPRADIRLVTNGVLLPKMDERFWRACKDNGVVIDMTRYPIPLDVAGIRRLAAESEVRIAVVERKEFVSCMNLNGDSDPHAAMKNCRSHWYCPFLQEGMLYACSMPATAHYFNARFNTAIPADGGINIHDGGMTGWHILSLLERPVPACRYCAAEWGKFDWAASKREIGEWQAR
jgi:hypothetical protein